MSVLPLPIKGLLVYIHFMLVFLGILAALALGGIIYIFLSKKSSKIQKLASLGALILSGLVLGVCSVILVFGNAGQAEDPYAFPLAAEKAEPSDNADFIQLSIFLVILVAIFGFIIYLGIREQKRKQSEKIDANKKKSGLSTDEF